MPKMNSEKFDQNLTLAKDEQVSTEAGSTFDEPQHGEGSVRYRIAVMVVMFLLALAGFLFWFFVGK